jgi:hypothetical protein
MDDLQSETGAALLITGCLWSMPAVITIISTCS